MNYQDLLDKGFKRNDIFSDDKQFFKQHGYDCFWLEFHLMGKMNRTKGLNIAIQWDPTKDKLELITDKKGQIVHRCEITGDEMNVLIKVNSRKGDLPKPQAFTMAC